MTALSQTIPGGPETNGLTPVTPTTYVNGPEPLSGQIWFNNNHSENTGVGIAENGNIIIGWEDDGPDIVNMSAVWTFFSPAGEVLITDPVSHGWHGIGSWSTPWVSYFWPDGGALYGGTSRAPKIKANLFGGGMGMGATSTGLTEEVAALNPWDDEYSGAFPSVQLVDDQGKPLKILPGVSAAYATSDPNDIEMADWDYLSNGNVVIVSDSHQTNDLVNLYGGSTPADHAIYRVVDPNGTVVQSETLVSQQPLSDSLWHGVGVVSNGFAVRYLGPSGVTVRLFDNLGVPTSDEQVLADITGFAAAGGGGRGENSGFHGNGADAYVAVAPSVTTQGVPVVWLTVLDSGGHVRFSRSAIDDVPLIALGRVDAAIDTNGSVVVVFDGKTDASAPYNSVFGRRFDASGTALGSTFFISESERPGTQVGDDIGPRVAWRGSQIVVAWQSRNVAVTWVDPSMGGGTCCGPIRVIAFRTFSTAAPSVNTHLPTLNINRGSGALTLTWDATATGYELQCSASVNGGPWVACHQSTPASIPLLGQAMYFRLYRK